MFEYLDKIKLLIQKVAATQEDQLLRASEMLAEVMGNDGMIHTMGTGHSQMIGMELFARAANPANVNAIMDDMVLMAGGARRSAEMEQLTGLANVLWNKYDFAPSDVLIVVSNSGRNTLPLEMAMKAKKEGLKTIAITSLEQSRKYESRHASGKKLFEIADLVIDNCVPSGDGVIKTNKLLIGPASSVLGMIIMNIISSEAIKKCLERGVEVSVFQSQNIDEADNEALYEKYASRAKHL